MAEFSKRDRPTAQKAAKTTSQAKPGASKGIKGLKVKGAAKGASKSTAPRASKMKSTAPRSSKLKSVKVSRPKKKG